MRDPHTRVGMPTDGEDVPSYGSVPAEELTTPGLRPAGHGYVARGELGRGGIARVQRMFDPQLDREVAMKVLDPRYANSKEMRLGLEDEARVTARLDHAHIVPVHALGVDSDGTPFFTMKVVRGLTLRAWLNAHTGPTPSERFADAMEVFLKVCDAVAFAHDRGVIHRDVKPDNVMVGSFGEVYLMDWGLAVTRTAVEGRAVGTPAYLPPEQANGLATDSRADVFSLGGLLYFIVAGKAPYAGGATQEVLRRARACEWVDLAEVPGLPYVPHGLLPTVRKAMAMEPEDRFQTVTELATAVRGFLRMGLHMPTRSFARGDVILREGEAGEEAYILTEGAVRVWRLVDGQPVTLREMGPGAVFGELAILSDRPRTATVEALTDVTVQVVSREILAGGLGLQSWVGTFVRALAQRFSELEDQVMAAKAGR